MCARPPPVPIHPCVAALDCWGLLAERYTQHALMSDRAQPASMPQHLHRFQSQHFAPSIFFFSLFFWFVFVCKLRRSCHFEGRAYWAMDMMLVPVALAAGRARSCCRCTPFVHSFARSNFEKRCLVFFPPPPPPPRQCTKKKKAH